MRPFIARDATETPILKNLERSDLAFTDDPEIDSLYKVLAKQCKEGFGDYPLYGYREYLPNNERGAKWVWQSRQTILERVHNFGEGLSALGLKKGSKIAFMSFPREEFNITHIACSYKSFCLVSVYETLPDNIAAYIIEHSEAEALIILEKFLPKLKEIVKIQPILREQLKNVIVLDSRPDEEHLRGDTSRSIDNFHMTFTEVEELGSKQKRVPQLASAEDITVLMYTSGTTGNPKGVTLPSRAILSTGYALSHTMPPAFGEKPEEIVHISYLPYSHIFAVVMESTIVFIIFFFKSFSCKLRAVRE